MAQFDKRGETSIRGRRLTRRRLLKAGAAVASALPYPPVLWPLRSRVKAFPQRSLILPNHVLRIRAGMDSICSNISPPTRTG